MSFEYKIKATLTQNGESFFGPGCYSILKGIEKTQSLQSACRDMNMAYSKGWRLLKQAEKAFGQRLVLAQSGGAGGGGSELTAFAKKACAEYEAYCAKLKACADSAFTQLKESLENEAD